MPIAQAAAVLFARPPTLQAVERCLRGGGALRVEKISASPHWADGGPTLATELDGRRVLVDVVARPWPKIPDDLARDPALAGAFARGAFGPGARPESYESALAHPWAWKESRLVAPRHQAFVRARLDRQGAADPPAEMIAVTRAVAVVIEDFGALCGFFPAGESLRPVAALQRGLRRIGPGPAPLDLWTNARLAQLPGTWQVMDTIGMAQIGLPDLEATFPQDRADWREIDAFLRNVCLYLADRGPVLKDGDRMAGPGDLEWQVHAPVRPRIGPDRPVVAIEPPGAPAR